VSVVPGIGCCCVFFDIVM